MTDERERPPPELIAAVQRTVDQAILAGCTMEETLRLVDITARQFGFGARVRPTVSRTT